MSADVPEPATVAYGHQASKIIDGLLGASAGDYALGGGALSTQYWVIKTSTTRTVNRVVLYMAPTVLDHVPVDGEISTNPRLLKDFTVFLRDIGDNIVDTRVITNNNRCYVKLDYPAVAEIASVQVKMQANNGASSNTCYLAELVVT